MKLVIASHNEGKVKEFRTLLAPMRVDVVSAAELNLPEPEETGATFIENANIKSESAALLSGLPALADDSGLCVEALGGAPGIYSARWAGPKKDFSVGMERIKRELEAKGVAATGARAYFICVLSYITAGVRETFEGRVEGTLRFPPHGGGGFGYDPIFVPTGYDKTFAEIGQDVKDRISHRARAYAKFAAFMKEAV